MKYKIIFSLCGVMLLIQLIRPDRNIGNIYSDSHISQVVSVPSEVNSLLQRACYDCHSNNTEYPWYAGIQPIAWWLSDHVEEGKHELNFSEFKQYSLKKQRHKLDEVAEMVREEEMPLFSYTIAHSNAKLTKDEIELIAMWAKHSADALTQQ